jgi:hypothetical protein
MTSRERVTRALRFEPVDRIPIENAFAGELARKYPSDIGQPPYRYPAGQGWGEAYKKGRRMDHWGCVWEAGEDGVCGEVKVSPLAGESWSGLRSFRAPWEVLEGADLSGVNPACAASDKFMIAMWDCMPHLFERMQHLRGTEQLYLDLALQEPEVFRLRDLVHEFFMKQMELWVRTDVDAVHLADDWGSQQALLISPAMWRAFFKPLYKDYCDLAHRHGKLVLMHSDGYTREIIPDLIEIGVNAVNLQLFVMPIEELAEEFAGKICFWGEIDRQRLLTSGTPEEVRAAVRRVAKAFLKKGRTGVVGQCQTGKDHRMENCEAVFEEWAKV